MFEPGGREARSALRIALPACLFALLIAPLAASASRSDRISDRVPGQAGPVELAPAGGELRSTRSEPDYVADELIVGYRAGTGGPGRAAVRAAARAGLERRLEVPRAELLRVRGNRSPEVVAAALERLPEVAYAQPNYIREIAALPDDPAFSELWGLHNTGQVVRRQAGTAGADISVLGAWDITTGSDAVTVAVVDTGIDPTHPDLAPNLGSGWDFVNGSAATSDPHGHGTHVAGTIGAAGGNGIGVAGVSWEVELMPVRVLAANGKGTDQRIADGFAYAAANGADVVNASLGGKDPSPLMDAAIGAAPEVLFVAAAGNAGSDNDATPYFPCNSPHSNVVCVAATDSSDKLAGFSNRGAASVDLAAPGVDILSTAPAGVDREYSFEGFEAQLNGRWASGGVHNTWARSSAVKLSGAWSLASTPNGSYLPNTDSYIDSSPIDLGGGNDCELRFHARGGIHHSDGLYVDVTDDGFQDWTPFGPIHDSTPGSGLSTTEWREFGIDLSDFDGAPELQFGFALFANGDASVGPGVRIDDARIICVGGDPGYDSKSGTSMATPHVAGTAALALADNPELGVGELRDAILDSVDPVAGLATKVATGGRLNAERAIEGEVAPPPPTYAPPRARIVRKPPRRSRQRAVRFTFRANAEQGQRPIRFQCRLNARKWRPCASPRRFRVKAGRRHIFRVRAIDQFGNRGQRAVWRFRVRR